MENQSENTQLPNVQVHIPHHQPTAIKTKRRLPKAVVFLLVLLFMSTIATAYWFLVKQPYVPTQDSGINAATSESYNSLPTEQTVTYFVSSEGYVSGVNKKIEIKLGVPKEYQSIDYGISIQDRGIVDYFGENFNASMGRWKFGYPTLPNGPVGEISIVNIEESWMTKSRPDPYEAHVTSFKVALNTPAQKKSYIAKIAKESTECSKDKGKGFIVGSLINVCYKLSDVRQAIGSYAPFTEFEGIGEKDGVKLYLYGMVRLFDGKIYSEEQQTAFQQNSPGDYAVEVQNRLIESIKKTTITVSDSSR